MTTPAAPDRPPELSPESRRRVQRAALLRPMALLMVLIGAFFFAATLAWWAVPLTLATYAALVFLAVRDPLFQNKVLGTGNSERPKTPALRPRPTSPEQRARRLPPGETRLSAERALEAHGRLLVAVEESDDDTRALLEDAVPKLRLFPERLLHAAEARENVAAKAQALRTRDGRSTNSERPTTPASLGEKLRAADRELSNTADELLALRAKVVRASIEGGDAAPARAAEINGSLNALNLRLEALRSTLLPQPER